jgi:hypothetical protein
VKGDILLSRERIGATIGHGGECDQPPVNACRADFLLGRVQKRLHHPAAHVPAPVFTRTKPPPALSQSLFSRHACYYEDTWRRGEGITQDFPGCPSSVGSPCGRCSHERWWRIRSPSANPFRAGFFVSGQSGQASSPCSEAYSSASAGTFTSLPST